MKLFNVRIAYHSTKQKGLTKFEDTTSDDNAYTGEGAMVHGYGLYLQEDKELNISEYKNGLSHGRSADYEIIVDYNVSFQTVEYGLDCGSEIQLYSDRACTTRSYNDGNAIGSALVSCIYDGFEKTKELFYKWLQEEPDDMTWKKGYEFLSNVNNVIVNKLEGEEHIASQYTVEIPDDFVFLNETELAYTPEIENVMKEFGFEDRQSVNEYRDACFTNMMLRHPDVTPSVFQTMWMIYVAEQGDDLETIRKIKTLKRYKPSDFGNGDIDETLRDIMRPFRPMLEKTNKAVRNGKDLYEHIKLILRSEKKASEYLYEHGINGIEYEGYRDGHCYVIFNCSELKIIKEE